MTVYASEDGAGVILNVQVVPRASRNKVVGVYDGRLKIQLCAPPVDNEANLSLCEFLADLLGVAKRQVSVLRGQTSKRKVIRIEGATLSKVVGLLD